MKQKFSKRIDQIADRLGVSRFEVLSMYWTGDWKGLGFESKNRICRTNTGIEYEEPNITIKERISAAAEGCRVLYGSPGRQK